MNIGLSSAGETLWFKWLMGRADWNHRQYLCGSEKRVTFRITFPFLKPNIFIHFFSEHNRASCRWNWAFCPSKDDQYYPLHLTTRQTTAINNPTKRRVSSLEWRRWWFTNRTTPTLISMTSPFYDWIVQSTMTYSLPALVQEVSDAFASHPQHWRHCRTQLPS